MNPPGTTGSLQTEYEAGLPFHDFVAGAEANADLWRQVWKRSRVPQEFASRLDALPCRWRLLVLAADWCGDGANTVPVLERLAEQSDRLELRILDRDANEALRDAHLTNGSKSIPVVMILDEDFAERGWWGPRPEALQRWVVEEGMAMEPTERYLRVRRWFAQDAGLSILEEVVSALEAAAAVREASVVA